MSRTYLLVRLEGPLQAWGDVTQDTVRPTRAFPSRSALAGLFASALGWTYRDGARTTAFQDALRYAVRADRTGSVMIDYQTAELTTTVRGWTHWGIEERDINNVTRMIAVRGRRPRPQATQILRKGYLADASFLAAVALDDTAPVNLERLAAALVRPARPVFLGRRACLPTRPLLEGRIEAESAYAALAAGVVGTVPCWYEPTDGPPDEARAFEVWDRRDFVLDRFEGARRVVRGTIIGGSVAA
ncbi:MAG: type I-E CRISPR-associated protein Cas5/CasD [Gemmatimonadaceae bacterium]|nr:type I-E CRISPR-associated protein Cas5/CasD [Gemmatimonadaceae bacterium]